jgi:hypothetical protein
MKLYKLQKQNWVNWDHDKICVRDQKFWQTCTAQYGTKYSLIWIELHIHLTTPSVHYNINHIESVAPSVARNNVGQTRCHAPDHLKCNNGI